MSEFESGSQWQPGGADERRTFKLQVDEQTYLFDKRLVAVETILEKVGKRTCEFHLVTEGPNGSVLEVGTEIDLEQWGEKKCRVEPRKEVEIHIDNVLHLVVRGTYSAAQIIALGGKSPEGYDLLEEKAGPPQLVPTNKQIQIRGCEVFFTQPRSGASS